MISIASAQLWVRDQDEAYASRVAAADFRVLELPHLGVTVVAGAMAHLVRDGRRLNERWGGDLDVLIEAGGRAFFEVSSPSDGWSSSLDCFYPTLDVGSCDVVDASGTPTNVRAGPSGRTAVLTTVSSGTSVPADDHVGSWYRLLTTPPGWAHESAVRCTLPPAARPCSSR